MIYFRRVTYSNDRAMAYARKDKIGMRGSSKKVTGHFIRREFQSFD